MLMLLAAGCAMPGMAQAPKAGDEPIKEPLLPNGSMDQEQEGKPAGWTTQTWGGQADFEYAKKGRDGRCVAVSSKEGADAAWVVRAPVEAYARYRVTGWIKTEKVTASSGKGALINIQGIDPAQTKPLTGTKDWTQVRLDFESDEAGEVLINCLLGGWGLASGRAWYDDLQLELLGKLDLTASGITIDTGKMGAPISKYIYSQFIEHLGRCIYGGIWAEMLEDRKFFYSVGDKESPWIAVGGFNSVEMVTENAYVGEHTPRINAGGEAPRGLLQQHLGLQKGRKYVGRAVLAGSVDAGPVQITLAWGTGEAKKTITIPEVTERFRAYPLAFKAEEDTEEGALLIFIKGRGHVDVGAVSLMPEDNIHGMRPDTLVLLKELDAPAYRWPGGNFVSGYNWKDGIGDRDKRPPRKNPAWLGVEHNDFGLDEFMVFCRELNTEPLIVVNSGLGDQQSAVEELQYANGAADTPMGQLRAANGHPEPYGVTWWGIGNEMYGDWQLGHMPLEEYVQKHNAYAEAMRAADPAIKLIGVGATGKWSETMLSQCADHMELLSEHFYCGEKAGLIGHVRQIPNAIRTKVKAHRDYHAKIPALKGKMIPICMDEWNYWYGPTPYGEIGTQYFLKDALGIAAGLHEYYRASDVVFMANYAQTVNVIGAIKTSKTAAVFDTTGLVLKLYRQQFGVTPVTVSGKTGALDVMAAWTEDRSALTVGVVNPTTEAVPLKVAWEGAVPAGTGARWMITGASPQSCNKPGQEPEVTITESAVEGILDTLESPPMSICLYRLPVK
jgi:alpha-N-arabinofuranosidase